MAVAGVTPVVEEAEEADTAVATSVPTAATREVAATPPAVKLFQHDKRHGNMHIPDLVHFDSGVHFESGMHVSHALERPAPSTGTHAHTRGRLVGERKKRACERACKLSICFHPKHDSCLL